MVGQSQSGDRYNLNARDLKDHQLIESAFSVVNVRQAPEQSDSRCFLYFKGPILWANQLANSAKPQAARPTPAITIRETRIEFTYW
jgi:hypothetical protein